MKRTAEAQNCSLSSRTASVLRVLGIVGWAIATVCPGLPLLEDVIPLGGLRPGILYFDSCIACPSQLRDEAWRSPEVAPTEDGRGYYLRMRCPITGARYVKFPKPVRLWGVEQVLYACPGWHIDVSWRLPWQEPEVRLYHFVVSRAYLGLGMYVPIGFAPVVRQDRFWIVYAVGLPPASSVNVTGRRDQRRGNGGTTALRGSPFHTLGPPWAGHGTERYQGAWTVDATNERFLSHLPKIRVRLDSLIDPSRWEKHR